MFREGDGRDYSIMKSTLMYVHIFYQRVNTAYHVVGWNVKMIPVIILNSNFINIYLIQMNE